MFEFVIFSLGAVTAYVLLRLIQRSSSSETDTASVRCPRCRQNYDPIRPCGSCGWNLGSFAQTQATFRILDALRRRGRIDEETYQQVSESLRAELKPKTVEQPSTPKPAAPPVIVAEVVDPAIESTSTPPSVASQLPSQPAEPQPVVEASVPISPPSSVRERAEQYATSRASAVDEPPTPPPTPRQPWSVWFAAFMEEKNIRWGELVGGLLIVSCTIALVVSFWSAIAQNTLLKFGVLNGVTAALFGVGIHAARHWKLPTTSQGILIIATLLVPLNFLAIAAFTDTSVNVDATSLIGEVVSAAIFSALVFAAASFITPRWPTFLAVGVIVPSVMQLVIRRFVDASPSMGVLYGLSIPYLATYLACTLWPIRRYRSKAAIPERHANELIKHLGLATFPVLTAGGLLLARTGQPQWTLEWLSPLSFALALPLLAVGLLLWKQPGTRNANLALVGSGLVVAAVMVVGLGCIAAWPQPILITAIALLGSALVAFVTLEFRITDGHYVIASLLALALVFVTHVVAGNLNWTVSDAELTLDALLSASTGQILAGVAFVGLATTLGLRRRPAIGMRYGIVSGACVVLSVLLLAFFGLNREGDPVHVTWFFALYASIALTVAIVYRQPVAVVVGAILLLGSLYQACYFGIGADRLSNPGLVMLLLHATFMTITAVAASWIGRQPGELVRITASIASMVTSSAVAINLLWAIYHSLSLGSQLSPIFLGWLAAIWLMNAILEKSSSLFIAFQTVLTLFLMAWLDNSLRGTEWYQAIRYGWLHPTSIQWQGILLTLCGLIWVAIRLPFRAQPSEGSFAWLDWLRTRPVSFDQCLLAIAMLMLLFLATYGAVPGIAQELSPQQGDTRVVPAIENFQLGDLPTHAAHSWLTWLLAGLLLVSHGISFSERPRYWDLSMFAIALSAIPLLIASQWQGSVSVASATRWSYSIFFLVGSTFLWLRRPFSHSVGPSPVRSVNK